MNGKLTGFLKHARSHRSKYLQAKGRPEGDKSKAHCPPIFRRTSLTSVYESSELAQSTFTGCHTLTDRPTCDCARPASSDQQRGVAGRLLGGHTKDREGFLSIPGSQVREPQAVPPLRTAEHAGPDVLKHLCQGLESTCRIRGRLIREKP